MDVAILELVGPLLALPPGQPLILSIKQVRQLLDYLDSLDPDTKVKIRLEGLGKFISLSRAHPQGGGRQGGALQVCSRSTLKRKLGYFLCGMLPTALAETASPKNSHIFPD
jgi:hypothetical protein